MAAPRLTKTEREEHLLEVARLDRRRYSIRRIAKLLGFSPASIHRDLSIVRKRYEKQTLAERGAAVNEQVAAYDDEIAELYKAWERSKKDKEKRTAETSGAALPTSEGQESGSARTKVVKATEGRLPQIDYMREIRERRQEIAKLRGLYPPTKIASTNPDGTATAGQLTDSQIIAGLRELGSVVTGGKSEGGAPDNVSLQQPAPVEPAGGSTNDSVPSSS